MTDNLVAPLQRRQNSIKILSQLDRRTKDRWHGGPFPNATLKRQKRYETISNRPPQRDKNRPQLFAFCRPVKQTTL